MENSPVPIETVFAAAARGQLEGLDYDVQIGRYRVDFSLPSEQVIIELVGNTTHNSAELRTDIARRERYLQREGFAVIRFTRSEVFADAAKCVKEVQQYVRAQKRDRVPENTVYVDGQYLSKAAARWTSFYKDLYPHRINSRIKLSDILIQTAGWLRLEGDYEVHLFSVPGWLGDSHIEVDTIKFVDYPNGVMVITEHQPMIAMFGLSEHLKSFGQTVEELVLVADDPGYGPILSRPGSPQIDKLLRNGNDETHMLQLDDVPWQNVGYVLGTAMGLHQSEL